MIALLVFGGTAHEPSPGRGAYASLQASYGSVDLPQPQATEVRRAFYAGVIALKAIMFASLSPGDEITDADRALFAELDAELIAFVDALKAGHGMTAIPYAAPEPERIPSKIILETDRDRRRWLQEGQPVRGPAGYHRGRRGPLRRR